MAKKNNLNAKNLLVYGGLAFLATKLFGKSNKSNKSTAPVYDPSAPITADYTRTSETNLRDPNEIESSTATFVGGIRRKRK